MVTVREKLEREKKLFRKVLLNDFRLVYSLGLLSHLSLRPQQSGGHFYNPAELASNLQHLQHLHSVQQQIAAAAAAAAGASSYWTSLNKGRETVVPAPIADSPATWRYESSPQSLSVKPFAVNNGPTDRTPPPVGQLSNKRKRTDSDGEDGERRSSPASFNQDGKLREIDTPSSL